MHKIVIIEDEKAARKKLVRYLDQLLNNEYELVAELETVENVKKFFSEKRVVDIIFSDIELRDGNVFEVYTNLSITSPIIFITAYNEFLMHAFETNGIEYLLKPYSYDRFIKAWNKYVGLKNANTHHASLIAQLGKFIQNQPKHQEYIDQLAIKSPKGIYFLRVEDMVYIAADQGVLSAMDKNNRKHILTQQTLKEIEDLLDPSQFFRINRSEFVNRKYIERLERYDKNSYAIYLHKESVVMKTSQSITPSFTKWLGI